MSNNMDERLLDLLCDKATGNLSDEEARELAELSTGANSDMDAQSLELAAAAIMLAETEVVAMPPHLEAKIARAAEWHFAALAKKEEEPEVQRTFAFEPAKPARSILDWLGWGLAAVACIALAVVVYTDQSKIGNLEAQVKQLQAPAPAEPTLAEKRDQLIRDAKDVVRASWTKGNVKESEGVTGEVVWSDEKQMGYMTFKGLPANDPNREAYQLWIFEQAQLEAHPKDGGVFTIPASGEVVVPIEAKLKTYSPKAFAVTVEKPGGVVVSDRKKIAALAPVKPSQT